MLHKDKKSILITGILLSLLASIVGVSIPYLAKKVIDFVSLKSIVFLILAFLIQLVLAAVSLYVLSIFGNGKAANLRSKTFKHLIFENQADLDNLNSGKTAGLILSTTDVISEYYSIYLPNFFDSIFTLILSFVALLIMDWKLTILMIILLPILGFIIVPIEKLSASSETELQNSSSSLSGNITEAVQNSSLIKIMSAERLSIKKNDTLIKEIYINAKRLSKINSITSPLVFLFIFGIVSVIFIYGGVRVSTGSMRVSTLISFLIYLFQMLNPISFFTGFFAEHGKKLAAQTKLDSLTKGALENKGEYLMNLDNKDIRFTNVSFKYPNSKNQVLYNINLYFKHGTHTALVGPTGSGKTTIVNLISGLYHNLSTGNIKIGNININKVLLSDYRHQLGYVTQEAYFFDGTIYENLVFGLKERPEPYADEITAALQSANIYKEVMTFSNGIFTEIGERGIKLSGGQRQRLQIAKMFLQNPKILILDEATANLDSESEAKVISALQKLMVNRTTITIAHRLSTIEKSDLIYFIEDGKVTGCGAPDDLYKSHKKYRRYVNQQNVTHNS